MCSCWGNRMRFFRLATLATLVLTAGCAATPLPTYYLLPAPEVAEGTQPYSGGTVAVREVEMPLYARLLEFASLAGDGSVDLSENDRWADEPSRATTRALSSALKRLTGAPVVTEPWPDSISPTIRVDVTVDRFIGDLTGGSLEFTGQYRILRLGSGGDGEQSGFDYRIPIGEAGYKPLAAAHSRAIARLAEDIAARIAGGGA